MRYTLQVDIRMVEIPEPPEQEQQPVGDDPMQVAHAMVGVMRTMSPSNGIMPVAIPLQPSGMEYHKSIAVNASNWDALSGIVKEYDELTQKLQLERI